MKLLFEKACNLDRYFDRSKLEKNIKNSFPTSIHPAKFHPSHLITLLQVKQNNDNKMSYLSYLL